MTRLARVGAGALVIAIAALVAHQLFVAAWSNRCDPGNARFELLKSDPVMGYHAPGEAFTWENDGPDNLFTCSNASIVLDHVGQDVKGMYAATRNDMLDSGWTVVEPGAQPAPDFVVYAKLAPGNIRLTGVVLQQAEWVEVDLSAPGLHPGESGF